MGRWFNVEGPCVPAKHYMIPASARLPEVPGLVARERYFVVHAPRQSGKTTALQALAAELTASGRYAAVVLSMEAGRAWGDDIGAATHAILDSARSAAQANLPAELRPPPWPEASDGALLARAFGAWSRACPRPLVLFLDEIDTLEGRTLISVLSQLRDGFRLRPANFPASVALCGLRDVRDYKAASGGDPTRLRSGSPFNIKKSLRLNDFTLDEVRELYGQHTGDTGQMFTPEAVAHAWELTRGQPWLVNAIAAEIVDNMGVPATTAVTAEHVDQAAERIIMARETHIDSLVDKLREPAVRRVIEPLLAGKTVNFAPFSDDLLYTIDLGLVRQTAAEVEVANPIYRNVITRVLADSMFAGIPGQPGPRSFILPDGRFDLPGLLTRFTDFWHRNEDVLNAEDEPYREVSPHLVLLGYLDRSINGNGFVDREYGVGRRRMDLYVRWNHTGADGNLAVQREALELKTHRPGDADPTDEGIHQLDSYLLRLGLPTGYLVIFDQRPAERKRVGTQMGTQHITSPSARTITIVRI